MTGKSYVFSKTSQMASLGAIPTIAYYTKQPNPWPNSPASQVVNYSCCLLVKGICRQLKATRTLVDVWQASETSHSKSSPNVFQHQYLPELLVNVYGYHLMVKSLTLCCVCGRWLFSNLVTFLFLT